MSERLVVKDIETKYPNSRLIMLDIWVPVFVHFRVPTCFVKNIITNSLIISNNIKIFWWVVIPYIMVLKQEMITYAVYGILSL